jgi:plastocyanin
VTIDDSPGLTPVHPYWVSVVPCKRDPQYSVPGGGVVGSSHSRRAGWTVPVTGRIVAMGGHMHGGGRSISLSQPRCGDRLLQDSLPTYAPRSSPLYRVVPLLHEPDPVNMTWWQSAGGWNVKAGERLRVSAVYDDRRPHMRVMGIMHVYIAEDAAAAAGCGEAPPDAEIKDGSDVAGGVLTPPPITVPFESLGSDGVVRQISRPPGALHRYDGDARVTVRDFRFRAANLSVPAGARVSWHFGDPVAHDATLVNGPRGFGTATVLRGHTESHRFTVPGVYRIYCSIHPVYMTQVIWVRRDRRRR